MTKNFSHNGLFVNFICRAFDFNVYRIYDRATGETREVRKYDDGRITRGAGEVAQQNDIGAVQALLAADKAEFQQWLAERPELAAAYAKLST